MNGRNPPLSIGQMVAELWDRRRLLIVAVLVAGVVAAVVTLFIRPSYRATVILAQPEKSSESGGLAALAGQFSGLADLAGVNLGGGGDVDQSIAIMTSRQFTEQFLVDENILQALYPERWDAAANRWKPHARGGVESMFSWVKEKLETDDPPSVTGQDSERPSLWKAAKEFARLATVAKDKKTSLITLTVDWRDPVIAARWANDMVSKLNQTVRNRAIADANRSLDYLNGEVNGTHVVEMQQTIYRLIEREMRTKVSAFVRDEYAFRVLDPATPPEERESPKRTLITLAAMFTAGFCASLWVLFVSQPRRTILRSPDQAS
jgi:uncharacterized protein involved in exopolysaccharide biosynthesis